MVDKDAKLTHKQFGVEAINFTYEKAVEASKKLQFRYRLLGEFF